MNNELCTIHAFIETIEGNHVKVKCALCPFERAWPIDIRYHPEPVLLNGRLYPVTVKSIGVNVCAECHAPIYAGTVVGIGAGDGEHTLGMVWFHRWCAPIPVLCDPNKIELSAAVDDPAFAI